ncbi:MAG TPA: DUF3592 domain-containing protein [Thermoanaerobaculia bacterium]|jgi:hypothetical protein|nr:DUF3592 domain-containing protein [Thermoanaerobaculia bacterium]
MKKALLFGGVPVIAGIVLIVVWALANAAAPTGKGHAQVLATIEKATAQAGAIEVAYRYEYGGREYRNPHGRISGSSGANRYAPGRRVIAYVNPKVPSESFLERSAAPPQNGLIAGVVLIAVGIPLFIYFLREKKRKRKPLRKVTRSTTMSRLKPPPSVPRH